jgi:hypothetical protein
MGAGSGVQALELALESALALRCHSCQGAASGAQARAMAWVQLLALP